MNRSPGQLCIDAQCIWRSGVDSVRSDRLVRSAVHIDGSMLVIGPAQLNLNTIGRIAVVGAGKAGAGMAAAIEDLLGQQWIAEKELFGWVNVPADCVRPLQRIKLHAARPAGINEPQPEGVAGALKILDLVASLSPQDLCLCLLSGGGSALMPAPVEGIGLADKLAVTRYLSAQGANIEQLNTVRKQISRIKGGGLARACRAGRLIALIISDVPGDPLEVIASGPTVADSSSPATALQVLDQFHAREAGIPPRVFEYLQCKARLWQANSNTPAQAEVPTVVKNIIIGNNALAVEAASLEAKKLGYNPAMYSAKQPEGLAEEVGRQLAEAALRMRVGPGPNCLVSGGEPVVALVEASSRGLGGRNQQLVLAAVERLWLEGAKGVAVLSGGTDGEDGPTDAAGAVLDAEIISAAKAQNLDPADFLASNDAYRFFERCGGLMKTGPTHTNVCDLRVVVVDRG